MDKKRRTRLDMAELLELVLGPGGDTSKFPSEAERREAWEANREDLLSRHPECWAARRYEAPDPDGAPWEPGLR